MLDEPLLPGAALDRVEAWFARTEVRILEIVADGYRLRLVDHPAAFDRDGLYGPPGADYPDNAWRFGLLCRAALETLRMEQERPVDVLHLHDWHAGPAAIQRDAWLADDPVIGRAAIVMTLHNLAYHGWTQRDRLRQRPGRTGLARQRRYALAARVNALLKGLHPCVAFRSW